MLIEIVIADEFKQFNLDQGLVVEFLFIPDNFQGCEVVALVIEHFKNLPERAFSEHFNDFVTVGNMIVESPLVVSPGGYKK